MVNGLFLVTGDTRYRHSAIHAFPSDGLSFSFMSTGKYWPVNLISSKSDPSGLNTLDRLVSINFFQRSLATILLFKVFDSIHGLNIFLFETDTNLYCMIY